MNKGIGQRLKDIRLSLGLSQKEMVEGIMDRSSYSRIESGKTLIGISSLLKILELHQISILDFFGEWGEVKAKNRDYENAATDAFLRGDVELLTSLKNDPTYTAVKVKHVIGLMIAELTDDVRCFPSRIKRELKYNVLQIGEWDSNSLWILAHSMILYKFKDLEGLVGSVFNKFKNPKDYDDQVLRLVALGAVNYLQICLKQKEANYEIEKTLAYLKELPNLPVIMLEKMAGEYFSAKMHDDHETLKEIEMVLEEGGYGYYVETVLKR